jgi:ketosteroid isomerase-like protein
MKVALPAVLSFLVLCGIALAQTEPSREQEIRQLVERYDNALNHKDVAVVEQLLAPEYVYFSSKGEVRSRQSLLDELLSPKYILASAERTEVKVYQTSGTAVVSSRWKGQGAYDGQPFHDDQRCSIILARDKQQWLVVSEHCTQIVPTKALNNLEGEPLRSSSIYSRRIETSRMAAGSLQVLTHRRADGQPQEQYLKWLAWWTREGSTATVYKISDCCDSIPLQ